MSKLLNARNIADDTSESSFFLLNLSNHLPFTYFLRFIYTSMHTIKSIDMTRENSSIGSLI